jgi:Na+-driven multidrug efflux pump
MNGNGNNCGRQRWGVHLPIRCLILLIDAFDMHGFWLGFPFNMLGYSRMCRYYIFLEDIQRINTK